MTPKPPMRFLAVSLVLDGLKSVRLVVPVAAILGVLAILSATLVAISKPEQAARFVAPDADPAWAVGARVPVFAALGAVAIEELPAPSPRQRLKPNCDPDLERELRGACWVPVDVKPCPRGKAYLNDKGPDADGKCYARGMRAEPVPTSGEPRPAGMAEP